MHVKRREELSWGGPGVGVVGCLEPVRGGGDLRGGSRGGLGASPAGEGAGEREGSLAAKTVWEQALFVQIHFRVGTAHLTAQRAFYSGSKSSTMTYPGIKKKQD